MQILTRNISQNPFKILNGNIYPNPFLDIFTIKFLNKNILIYIKILKFFKLIFKLKFFHFIIN